MNLGGSQRKAQINALSMLSVLDHHLRCELNENAFGILLGINDTKISIRNVFPAKIVDGEIDFELAQKMEQSLQQNNDESVIGWYCCAPALDEHFIKMDNLLADFCMEKAPICLWIDTSSEFVDCVPAKCFVLSPCQVQGSETTTGFTVEIPLQVQESAGLLAAQNIKNSPQEPLQQLETSLTKIIELLAILKKSTQKMAESGAAGNVQLGKLIAGALNAMPKTTPQQVKSVVDLHVNDHKVLSKLLEQIKQQLKIAESMH